MELSRRLPRGATSPPAHAAYSLAPDGQPWRSHFFNPNLRIVDTLSLISAFTSERASPGKGAWTLGNVFHHVTGKRTSR